MESLCCDSTFAHKKEFSIFKFPERFLEISCRAHFKFDFFNNSNHLKDLVIHILWTLEMSFSDNQGMILSVIIIVYQTQQL
jgi:hypothetical protein